MPATPIRYLLKKKHRLKSRKAIEQIFEKGKHINAFPLKLFWIPVTQECNLQAGFGVSSRFFKKAVHRNRIKRLMKEAYRLQKNELSQSLLNSQKNIQLFIMFTSKEIPEYVLVFEKINVLLAKLQKALDANN